MSSDAEVAGKYITALLDDAKTVSPMFERKAREYLEENNIENPNPDDWYPMDSFVEVLQRLDDDVGSVTVKKAGREMAKNGTYPDDVDTVDAGLIALSDSHQLAHRNATKAEYGSYEVAQTSPNTIRVSCPTQYPYPASLARGVVNGVTEIYNPLASVTEIEEQSTEKCAFEIRW